MEFAPSFHPGAELLGSSLRTLFLIATALASAGVLADVLYRSRRTYSPSWRPIARLAISILWGCLAVAFVTISTALVLLPKPLTAESGAGVALLLAFSVGCALGLVAWHAILRATSSDRFVSLFGPSN